MGGFRYVPNRQAERHGMSNPTRRAIIPNSAPPAAREADTHP